MGAFPFPKDQQNSIRKIHNMRKDEQGGKIDIVLPHTRYHVEARR
jgi:hypothetical protein